jgi:hypothetical protein
MCYLSNLYVCEKFVVFFWPYVAMSRVTTLDGLFLGKPLDPKKEDFSVPKEFKELQEQFRRNATPLPFDYNSLNDDVPI